MKPYYSFLELNKALNSKETNCLELTQVYLSRISEYKNLNIFVEVFEQESLKKARIIDEKIKAGTAGRLAGMVVGIKDNICFKGHKVSAASKILDGFESMFTATAVQRLIDQDAIIIGRLNCDEFGMGSANENTVYGPVKNPLDITKVAGGSSGGSAAAVAAGLCLAALGSDTGGSVRQPAAFCGVVGVKPTYSRVSRHGLIAYGSSFDQIGPITNNTYDAALILEVISGVDHFDSTASSLKVEKYTKIISSPPPKKIAYFKQCLELKILDAEIKKATENKIFELRSSGYSVEVIDFPYFDVLMPIYYILSTAEASSNLARYDGVHYGYRNKENIDLESTYKNSRTSGFGEEVKRRIMLGTFVLSSGYNEEFYTKALKIRRLIQEKTKEIFQKYDLVISPATPHTAFSIGAKNTDPTKAYLEDIFTVQANLTGAPAITIPICKHSNGMPISMHVMADMFNEGGLFSFVNSINKE